MSSYTCFFPTHLKLLFKSFSGTTIILEFLFHFAFPWLALRQGLRSNDSDAVDSMWRQTCAWFRATNKNNYATMAVDVTFYMNAYPAVIRELWQKHRTMSLTAQKGCNVAWDRGMEEMNREVKCGLGHEVTKDNIDSYILQVLGLRHVWLRLRPLVGTLHGGEDADDGVDVNMEETRSEFTRANENDVKHIVDLLKKTLL